MIPRTLVPVDVRPVTKDEARRTAHRVTTYMDDRTVVPSGLSEAPPLDGRTTIPSHLPLGVLVDRTLVPRGMAAKPLERMQHVSTVTLEILDTRTVVPAYVEPLTEEEGEAPERAPEMTAELREIVQPDIFTTGDANLLIEPEEKTNARSELVRVVGSVVFHAALILFLIFAPKLIPAPTQEEIGRNNLDTKWMYSPPPAAEPVKPTPKVNVNRETLNRVAPPEIKPPAPPVPEKPAPELPEAPQPKPSIAPAPPQPQPSIPQPPAPSRLEPIVPSQPSKRLDLGLPHSTPGKLLDDQMQAAAHEGRGQAPIIGSGPPATGGHGIGMGYGVDILSDTQGVDFRDYITRLLATLRRNWDAVMPESARMGERGVVFTVFTINPDGSVSAPDPTLERTSGKEPLDNAAMAAIHASNPFEPLPKQFHGPNLRLRIAFLYNVRPEEIGLH
jgi:TonB family protein